MTAGGLVGCVVSQAAAKIFEPFTKQKPHQRITYHTAGNWEPPRKTMAYPMFVFFEEMRPTLDASDMLQNTTPLSSLGGSFCEDYVGIGF